MTDAEILSLIESDPELLALLKSGNDEALARALDGRVGSIDTHARINTPVLFDVLGLSRGQAVLAALRKSHPDVAGVVEKEGIDASARDASDFWLDRVAEAVVTAEEAAALIALGSQPVVLHHLDVARIVSPYRIDGRLWPAAATIQEAEVAKVAFDQDKSRRRRDKEPKAEDETAVIHG